MLKCILLLVLVKYVGLTSSGSQRWLNLYFINLQPSELMKIGLILFLAKYYHRISSGDVNRAKFFYQKAISIKPDYYHALLNLGVLMEASWRSWRHLGSLGGLLERLERVLGQSWGHRGPSWKPRGAKLAARCPRNLPRAENLENCRADLAPKIHKP